MAPPPKARLGCEVARKWKATAAPGSALKRAGVAPAPPWPGHPRRIGQIRRTECPPRPLPHLPLFHGRHAEESAERPHLVTIIRPSQSALRKVSVLLNRRGVVSFEQLLLDISEALGFPRWHSSRVTRLFTTFAWEVKSISDFFRGDVAFLALGKARPDLSSLQEALEELFPENSRYRAAALLVWEKKLRPAPDKAAKADSGYSEGTNRNKNLGADPSDTPPFRNGDTEKVKMATSRKAARLPNHLQRLHVRGGICEAPPPLVGQFKQQLERETGDKHFTPLCESCLSRRPKHHSPEWIDPLSGRVPLPPVSRKQRGSSPQAQEVRWRRPPLPGLGEVSGLPSEGSEVSQADIERLYDIGRQVGDGNFAVVHECRRRLDRQTLAVKIVERSRLVGREHMLQNELCLLGSLRHPRIVRLLAHHHTLAHTYLVMELASGGDLFEAISQRGSFPEAEAGLMVSDMSEALKYIHRRSVVHRDLKPENLLIVHAAAGITRLKLADFGLAMIVTEPVFTICGTPTYVAPEVLSETGYSVEVDMWALGVILYILLCGFAPFRSRERNQEELFQIIKQAQLHFLPPYWDTISAEAKDLVTGLLQSDPAARMTAEQSLQHPWLRAMALRCQQRALRCKDDMSTDCTEEELSRHTDAAHKSPVDYVTQQLTETHSTGRQASQASPAHAHCSDHPPIKTTNQPTRPLINSSPDQVSIRRPTQLQLSSPKEILRKWN
ncbi:serine/threonine-protein kinase DCLK3 [Dunckerocampus dactyliophorus]|uniref:serine/threonine-protein kinase DCLK3 n=1 Tax=Dunckerocampus dactyliophorus TaxID=161453 RepID=UPI0024075D82|nr:serine/threonine-protein kinase DCLK3 [Dunckerocampus dactyliophorus]